MGPGARDAGRLDELACKAKLESSKCSTSRERAVDHGRDVAAAVSRR